MSVLELTVFKNDIMLKLPSQNQCKDQNLYYIHDLF